jgi:HlyD family secretion protein
MLRVLPGFSWTALAGLIVLLVLGLLTSVLFSASVTVPSRGVLLSPLGVADIVAPAGGRLSRFLVKPGDRVRAGQAVATLEQPELEADLSRYSMERAKLEDQESQVRHFLQTEEETRTRLAAGRQDRLRTRIATLQSLEATTAEMVATQEDMLKRGLASRERLLAVRRELEEVQSQRSEAESALQQITADAEAAKVRAERELLDLGMRVSANARDIAWAEGERARRSTVLAQSDGVVVEQVLNTGEMATASAPVLRMLPGEPGEGLVGLLYVPPSGGRKVQAGMAARIMPAGIRVERYGFIEGRVTEVSPIAATREGMMRTLKNSTLVEQLLRDGAPMQIVVHLTVDPASPTHLRWSAGQGPDTVLGADTMVEGSIVTGRASLISLVLPQAEYVLARLGL